MEDMLVNHREALTPDQGGTASTAECGDMFVKLLQG